MFPVIFSGESDKAKLMQQVCRISLVNGAGNPVFATDDKMLKALPGRDLGPLVGLAWSLNKVGDTYAAFINADATVKN